MSEEWGSTDLVFRQVNPAHWDGKSPNSQAFFPTPKDKDKLSVDDGRLVSAKESYRHFTVKLGLKSVGTWAVSYGEVSDAGDLQLCSSPTTDVDDESKSNPAHAHIDFSQITSKGQKKKRAQTLALKASGRGCLFRPQE